MNSITAVWTEHCAVPGATIRANWWCSYDFFKKSLEDLLNLKHTYLHNCIISYTIVTTTKDSDLGLCLLTYPWPPQRRQWPPIRPNWRPDTYSSQCAVPPAGLFARWNRGRRGLFRGRFRPRTRWGRPYTRPGGWARPPPPQSRGGRRAAQWSATYGCVPASAVSVGLKIRLGSVI